MKVLIWPRKRRGWCWRILDGKMNLYGWHPTFLGASQEVRHLLDALGIQTGGE